MEKYENLLLLAKDEMEGENYKEAERLINEALAIERNIVDAWIMKSRLAYYNDRGLSACYKYLKIAFDLSEDKSNIQPILDAFYEVSLKELKWQLDNNLSRLEYRDEPSKYGTTFITYLKEGTQLSCDFGTFVPTDNVRRDLIKYAAKAIEKAWRNVAEDYYKFDIANYGARWERESLYHNNDYRPTVNTFKTFVYSCLTLGEIIDCTTVLETGNLDFDLMLNLIKLGQEIMNHCLRAKAYSVSSQGQSTVVFDDEYNNDDFVIEEDYSGGFEIRWRVSTIIGDNIKSFCNKIKSDLNRNETNIRNRKKKA